MNTRSFIAIAAAAISSLAAGSAFADHPEMAPAYSTMSRAEVKAELARATAAGEINRPGEGYTVFRGSEIASTATRAEVVAELARARAAGELPTSGDTYGLIQEPRAIASVRSRAEVQAEAREAAQKRKFDVTAIGG